jgi:catechol 2,3 dioxygenase
MPDPQLARLAHVALATPDLDGSYHFFHDLLGLEEVGNDGDAVQLKAWGDFGHHTLTLIPSKGERGHVDHIAWRTMKPEHVEEYAARLAAEGVEVTKLAAGEENGQGEAIRFKVADRFSFEIYYDFDREDHGVNGARPASIKTNAFAPHNRGISPRRIDHVNLFADKPQEPIDFLQEHLGFKVRETLSAEDELKAAWMAVSPLPHDIGVGIDPHGGRAGCHHVGFFVDGSSDILRAAEIFAENGVPIDRGPGRHAISQALYLYVRDPASQHRVELFTGGYLVLDPDWGPYHWTDEDYHQWWGGDIPRLTAEDYTKTTGFDA